MSTGSVAVVVVEDSAIPLWDLYELSIACMVFGIPHPDLADPWYEMRLCAVGSGAPRVGQGFSLGTRHGLADLVDADTVVVPGVPEACVHGDQEIPAELVAALRAAHEAGARIVSLCTGAFALAAAGLLDGRRATAHWMHTAALAERFPAVDVDDSVLYVDDGDVLTSAGISAGLDLCLHLVRCDLGADVANRLARRLVVPPHRTGGQAQYVDLAVPVTDADDLGPVLQWATENLHRPLTVDDLAERAGMTTRTFYRRLHTVAGTTPLKWLLDQRLAYAQILLERTDLPVEHVSERSGLGTANNLRGHFSSRLGISPTDYRRSFRPVGRRRGTTSGTSTGPAPRLPSGRGA